MTEARDIPDAVLWHEGMLLAPQHFQQTAQRAEALLAYRVGAAVPYPWGVSRLAIDPAVLPDGLLRVDELEAVLPDGLILQHPRADEPPLELDLMGQGQDVRLGPRTLYVAVAARTGAQGGVGHRRYRSVEGGACGDETTGDGEIEIPRLVPAPLLLLGDEHGRPPPRRWSSLPLARIAFRDDLFVLDRFCGPRLRVGRETELFAIAAGIAARLREKAVALGERLQAPGSDGVQGGGWEAVRALARGLPRLEALLASQRAHPFDLFLALTDIVGSLTGIARQPCPAQLRAYDHNDPLPAYLQAAEIIGAAAGRLREPYQIVRFEHRGAGRFSHELPPALVGRELILGVRAAPGAASSAAAAWLETALIASASQLRAIRERRTLGAPRRLVDVVEELDLLPPRGVVLCRVGPDAGAIHAGEPLEIIGHGDAGGAGEPLEVLLFTAAPEPAA